jgi:hypothetical protein
MSENLNFDIRLDKKYQNRETEKRQVIENTKKELDWFDYLKKS